MIVERKRLEILVAVDAAEAALERGEGCPLSQEAHAGSGVQSEAAWTDAALR